MSWQVWALFAVTETALCLTPGPAVLLVLSQGLAHGTVSSTWSSLGILAGSTMYFVLSATSLGAMLVASYHVFSVIRWVGAGYLVWLGASAFLGKSPLFSVASAPSGPGRPGRLFIHGFVLQASNPKALVFFTAAAAVHRSDGVSCAAGGDPGRDKRDHRVLAPARLWRAGGATHWADGAPTVRHADTSAGGLDADRGRDRDGPSPPSVIATAADTGRDQETPAAD